MKKLALLIVAVIFAFNANAQLVVGLQGGYYHQSYNDPGVLKRFGDVYNGNNYWDTVSLNKTQNNLVAGIQVGYYVIPKLYVGIAAGYLSSNSDSTLSRDFIRLDQRAHTVHVGEWYEVDNHQFVGKRTGWSLAPQVKYEFARYGNMHFHLLLQGDIQSLGYSTDVERYNKPFENNELEDFDPILDSIKMFSWGISLRPTLTYEFSQHLSAELSLDFLSIGYVSNKTKYEGTTYLYGSNGQTVEAAVAPHDISTSTFYAGLNTFMQTLRWESPMLRLGFNWKF